MTQIIVPELESIAGSKWYSDHTSWKFWLLWGIVAFIIICLICLIFRKKDDNQYGGVYSSAVNLFDDMYMKYRGGGINIDNSSSSSSLLSETSSMQDIAKQMEFSQ